MVKEKPEMKVALLAPANIIHTIRWAEGLLQTGISVHLLTQHPGNLPLSGEVTVHELPSTGTLGYFRNVPNLRKLLAEIRPDLLHAHYASGYGTTARLSGFRPWIISAWGSDIYEFPQRSRLHRYWLKNNLRNADLVLSTSHAMARRIDTLFQHVPAIEVVPFGVDMDMFNTDHRHSHTTDTSPITIGTIKTLAPQYGIDLLIKSFSCLRDNLHQSMPEIADRLRLKIIGDGPEAENLQALAGSLGISGVTEFSGAVQHRDVPLELGSLDIFAALSRSESFGVAVVEASACGLPVVVADVGGLPEVVQDGVTGLVVPAEDPLAAATALETLVKDSALRLRYGAAGRNHVNSIYPWQACVEKTVDLYRRIAATKDQ